MLKDSSKDHVPHSREQRDLRWFYLATPRNRSREGRIVPHGRHMFSTEDNE